MEERMLDYINSLKVRTKLTILTSILILGMIIYGLLSTATLQKLAINGPYYKQIMLSQELIADILPPPSYIIEAFLLSYQEVDETNPTDLQRLLKRSEELRNQYEERHAYWDSALSEGQIRRVFFHESYSPAKEFFRIWENQFLPAIKEGNKEKALQIVKGPLKEQYDRNRLKIDEVVQLARQYNATLEKTIQDLGQRLQTYSNLSWLGTILTGILLASLISFSITSRLREVLKKIASSSKEIDSRMKLQSKSIQQQLTTVHETSSSMDEMNKTFKRTETLASEASNVSKNSLKVSEEGNSLIKKMLEGLIEHKDKVLSLVQHILRLSEITKQIHNIASITSNITNQTNILALNAAVQAAQVKQQSEGFTVIANEIRKLAEEGKKFLSHISVLVDNIEEAMKSTVSIAEEGNKTVQDCIKHAQSAVDALVSITSYTNASFEGAEEVSLNMKQQNATVHHVLEALATANKSMEQTQKDMELVEAELIELNAVSEELKTIV